MDKIDSVDTIKDWVGLARKIRHGVPIRDAAKACGIDDAELIDYISTHLQKPSEISFELKCMGEFILKKAVRALASIVEEGARMEDQMNKYNNSDLSAAKELSRIGVGLLKMALGANPEARSKGPTASLALDIYDDPGAWDLKKPGT